MNTNIANIKRLLTQGSGMDLQALLDEIYYCCMDRKDIRGEIQRRTEELDTQIDPLDYFRSDTISCAVNALCAEYDYIAFINGFQTGAGMILELLSAKDIYSP